MAVKEMVTHGNLQVVRVPASIATNTTTNTTIVDTADADYGVTFFIEATAYTDGTYKLTFQEGDQSDLSDATTVGSEKIVTVSGTDAVATGVTAATAAGDNLFKAGIHSTKRYVRAQVVSTGTTTGATIGVYCLLNGEVLPE